jgi:hypothetical protein
MVERSACPLAGLLGVPEELVDEAAGFEVRRRLT